MPQFTTTSIEEARRVTGGAKRQQELAAYIDSVTGLPSGTAGKVTPSEGETLAMVRRRLGLEGTTMADAVAPATDQPGVVV